MTLEQKQEIFNIIIHVECRRLAEMENLYCKKKLLKVASSNLDSCNPSLAVHYNQNTSS